MPHDKANSNAPGGGDPHDLHDSIRPWTAPVVPFGPQSWSHPWPGVAPNGGWPFPARNLAPPARTFDYYYGASAKALKRLYPHYESHFWWSP